MSTLSTNLPSYLQVTVNGKPCSALYTEHKADCHNNTDQLWVPFIKGEKQWRLTFHLAQQPVSNLMETTAKQMTVASSGPFSTQTTSACVALNSQFYPLLETSNLNLC